MLYNKKLNSEREYNKKLYNKKLNSEKEYNKNANDEKKNYIYKKSIYS